jgi:hypothetical protein
MHVVLEEIANSGGSFLGGRVPRRGGARARAERHPRAAALCRSPKSLSTVSALIAPQRGPCSSAHWNKSLYFRWALARCVAWRRRQVGERGKLAMPGGTSRSTCFLGWSEG